MKFILDENFLYTLYVDGNGGISRYTMKSTKGIRHRECHNILEGHGCYKIAKLFDQPTTIA